MTIVPPRPRLLYVLPYLGTGDSSHMAHIPALLEALDADTAGEFAQLLARPDVEHQALGRLMRSHGHNISGLTIGRHRCGDCRCSR